MCPLDSVSSAFPPAETEWEGEIGVRVCVRPAKSTGLPSRLLVFF